MKNKKIPEDRNQRNVLFYAPFAIWTPHFETELELAKKHIEMGDNVFWLGCESELTASCEIGPQSKVNCSLCMSRKKRGFEIIGLKDENYIRFGFKDEKTIQKFSFSSKRELFKFELDGLDIGEAVLSSLISLKRDPNPCMKENSSFIDASIKNGLKVFNVVLRELKEKEIDLIYVCNGRLASLRPALRAAQKLNIHCFVHERGASIKKYSITKNTFPHDLTYKKAEILRYWEYGGDNKVMISENWYKDRRAGMEQSWASFVSKQVKDSLPKKFSFKRRNIGIFISSEDEFEGVSGWENPLYKNQNEGIERILRESENLNEDLFFYIRVHPNLKDIKNSQTEWLKHLSHPNVKVIKAEEKVDTYRLIEACDKVLTFGSTVGIEAVFLGKPSILAGRSLYEDLEATYNPKSHLELMDFVKAKLTKKPIKGALIYGFWSATLGEDFKYFKPKGLFEGIFLEENFKLKGLKRLKFYFRKALEDPNLTFKKIVLKLKKSI